MVGAVDAGQVEDRAPVDLTSELLRGDGDADNGNLELGGFRMADIFISYGSQDRGTACALAEAWPHGAGPCGGIARSPLENRSMR